MALMFNISYRAVILELEIVLLWCIDSNSPLRVMKVLLMLQHSFNYFILLCTNRKCNTITVIKKKYDKLLSESAVALKI